MIEIYKKDFLAGPRKVLATVHRDGPVLITDNGRPVAALVKPGDVSKPGTTATDQRIIEAALNVLAMLPENNPSFWLHCPAGLAHALSDLCEAADQENDQ